MRAIFGLSGLLIVIGVIVWWMGAPGGELDQTRAVLKAGDQARDEVSQMTGHDTATGGRAMDSAVFELLTTNGKSASLLVSTVAPGGAYERYFGLKKDDVILAVEYQGFTKTVKEMDNAQDGKEQVAEAYQKSGKLMIKRAGKELTLPAAPPPPAPGTPPAPKSARGVLESQLEQIQNQSQNR